MAKHLRSSKFTATGIFDSLKSFSELEARISALPLEKERGDAFEVFAEAYLATQPICQAKAVWPQSSAPSTLLHSLGLPVSRDMGTDGLVELRDGRIASYQAKFYTGRPALNWGLLSTFFAISDRVAHTIIFTNSDSLASIIERRQNFIAIRGTDLDRLTPTDFSIIEKWLKGSTVVRVVPKPRSHQEKALKDLLPALASSDRATVIMACGTGKTLLSLWAAERMGVRNVLVLVPSLALIQQTLHGWLAATRWNNLAYLCVCSDPTITDGADELVVKRSDLDFEVTTAPIEVKRFLENDYDGVKVIFSTYMSAGVVGEALKGRNIFDLGIFDEAHKTAGREGKNSAFALSDKNLPLKKRLFMTATPRHYNVLKRDKEGDAKLVYSMDVPESYGQVIHKLPFASAARAGIICRYKVLISVVTSEMVEKELLRSGKVLVEGNEVVAQQVANQIALSEAVSKHDVKKIITFHRNVKSAQSFTSTGSEGIGNHLPDFSYFHVNGSMPSSMREKLMAEFKHSARGLISNARCLTEGVDVPVVDMVAFLAPKRSTVDIVQATGRAMRNAPDKECGYILVPLYLEIKKGECLDEAVRRANFEEVWHVLSALQEQDDTLADIIQEMRQERGITKGVNDARFREWVEILGPVVSLPELRKSITTSCVENLASSWDERFGELIAYKAQHGDCNVPQRLGGNPGLGAWVTTQRLSRIKGKLSENRIRKLTRIDFDWDPLASAWEANFSTLVKYKAKYGNCDVPNKWPEDRALSTWVINQRAAKIRKRISIERVNRLSALGFIWNLSDDLWEKNYLALKKYGEKHGNCRVPQKEPSGLGAWVATQRKSKSRGLLSKTRIDLLDAVGFEWDVLASTWESNLAALKDYKAEYGNCNVPGIWPRNPALGTWVANQRIAKSTGKLSMERAHLLSALGFEWDPLGAAWEEKFSELEKYKAEHGACNLPSRWPDNPSLGKWIAMQRVMRTKGKLSQERISKLDALGYEWDPFATAWEDSFHALEMYKAQHGTFDVRRNSPGNLSLARWVIMQRNMRNSGRLSTTREMRLSDIGFPWDPLSAAWDENFAALSEYKSRYGCCNVPRGWPKKPSLANWVVTQRTLRKRGQLAEDRAKRLTALGFEWDLSALIWENNFHALEDFKKKNGNCNVPIGRGKSTELGRWVSRQRASRTKGRLSEEQIQRLTQLGFVWDKNSEVWEKTFHALEKYLAIHGDCNVPNKYGENPSLGNWVAMQRSLKVQGKLPETRENRLTEIGFVWVKKRDRKLR